jgi:XrtJ-associated TM-motif-TM protein
MKNLGLLFVFALLFVAASSSLHAQTGSENGCPDSPENPTVVLGLVGSAGIGAGYLRQRIRQRRKDQR